MAFTFVFLPCISASLASHCQLLPGTGSLREQFCLLPGVHGTDLSTEQTSALDLPEDFPEVSVFSFVKWKSNTCLPWILTAEISGDILCQGLKAGPGPTTCSVNISNYCQLFQKTKGRLHGGSTTKWAEWDTDVLHAAHPPSPPPWQECWATSKLEGFYFSDSLAAEISQETLLKTSFRLFWFHPALISMQDHTWNCAAPSKQRLRYIHPFPSSSFSLEPFRNSFVLPDLTWRHI